jgi:hypothetical protein
MLVRAGGGDKWQIRLSRVPNVEEHIRIDGHVYRVQSVYHNSVPSASDGCAAELMVALD